jgi:hypothetical protein
MQHLPEHGVQYALKSEGTLGQHTRVVTLCVREQLTLSHVFVRRPGRCVLINLCLSIYRPPKPSELRTVIQELFHERTRLSRELHDQNKVRGDVLRERRYAHVRSVCACAFGHGCKLSCVVRVERSLSFFVQPLVSAFTLVPRFYASACIRNNTGAGQHAARPSERRPALPFVSHADPHHHGHASELRMHANT